MRMSDFADYVMQERQFALEEYLLTNPSSRSHSPGRKQIRNMVMCIAESIREDVREVFRNCMCLTILVDDKEPHRVVRYKASLEKNNTIVSKRGVLGVVAWAGLVQVDFQTLLYKPFTD